MFLEPASVGNEYIVQFCILLKTDTSGPLREFVKAEKMHPKPAFVEVSSFHLGDMVDVYVNDGWWTGRVIRKIGENEYLVHFDNTNQDIMYRFPFIRVHKEWDAANDIWFLGFMLSLSDI
ncbi:DUF724 domain-containing protein 2-like [Bidens hawaiensis]|uniref:DUF724 domain-containing protein 2-like n=1 Tax=Bidens hawaiensis TaxID=980011 RepID=UPI004049A5EB